MAPDLMFWRQRLSSLTVCLSHCFSLAEGWRNSHVAPPANSLCICWHREAACCFMVDWWSEEKLEWTYSKQYVLKITSHKNIFVKKKIIIIVWCEQVQTLAQQILRTKLEQYYCFIWEYFNNTVSNKCITSNISILLSDNKAVNVL